MQLLHIAPVPCRCSSSSSPDRISVDGSLHPHRGGTPAPSLSQTAPSASLSPIPVAPPISSAQLEELVAALRESSNCMVLTGAHRAARLGLPGCCPEGLVIRDNSNCMVLTGAGGGQSPARPSFTGAAGECMPHCFHTHMSALCTHIGNISLRCTGAGVSTESHIPDYRGPRGAYTTGFRPMTHQQVCPDKKVCPPCTLSRGGAHSAGPAKAPPHSGR